VQGIGKSNAAIDRVAEAVAAQGRELAQGPLVQGIGKSNAAIDRVAEAVAAQGRELAQGPLAKGLGRANEALERLREAVAQVEGAPALREKLERMRLEMEALGEQGLRMVDLLNKTQAELEAVKTRRQSRKKDA